MFPYPWDDYTEIIITSIIMVYMVYTEFLIVFCFLLTALLLPWGTIRCGSWMLCQLIPQIPFLLSSSVACLACIMIGVNHSAHTPEHMTFSMLTIYFPGSKRGNHCIFTNLTSLLLGSIHYIFQAKNNFLVFYWFLWGFCSPAYKIIKN